MALFKVLRGSEKNLFDFNENGDLKTPLKDGNAYFTRDTHNFYIDHLDENDQLIRSLLGPGKNDINMNQIFGSNNMVVDGSNHTMFGSDNIVGQKAYWIYAIDLVNKLIYLTENTMKDIAPIVMKTENEVEDYTDLNFITPEYAINDEFSLIAKSFATYRLHYQFAGKIKTIKNNVISYNDDLPFTELYADVSENSNVFFIPSKPEIGVHSISSLSFVEGLGNIVSGAYAHGEGYNNLAAGNFSHVEGRDNKASYCSHVEGSNSAATGTYSHAQGQGNIASATNCHVEGASNENNSIGGHVEGEFNYVAGRRNHVEGGYNGKDGAGNKITPILGLGNHLEGNGHRTNENTEYTHLSGYLNTSIDALYSNITGFNNTVSNANNDVSGHSNTVTGNNNTVTGYGNTVISNVINPNNWKELNNQAVGNNVSGYSNKVTGNNNTITGTNNIITSITTSWDDTRAGNFVSGENNKLYNGNYNTVFGTEHTINTETSSVISDNNTIFGIKNRIYNGINCWIGGENNYVTGSNNFVYGINSDVRGTKNIVLGINNNPFNTNEIIAIGSNNGSEQFAGNNNIVLGFSNPQISGNNNNIFGTGNRLVNGTYATVFNRNNWIGGTMNFVAGNSNSAYGNNGCILGSYNNIPSGTNHATLIGYGNKTVSECSTVIGKFNKPVSAAFIIGKGTGLDDKVRANIHTVDWNGNAWYAGKVTATEFSGKLYEVGTIAPTNTSLLWIDTTENTGGLKYYNKTSGKWTTVPVAYYE